MRNLMVTVRVPVDASWRAGYTLQIYSDHGSGTIDTGKPLLVPRVAMFPGKPIVQGAGLDAAGLVPAGGARAPARNRGGAGRQPAGLAAAGGSTPHIELVVRVEQGFGEYKFSAAAYDSAGNVQDGAPAEFTQLVSGGEPQPVSEFEFSAHDAGTDQATFGIAK